MNTYTPVLQKNSVYESQPQGVIRLKKEKDRSKVAYNAICCRHVDKAWSKTTARPVDSPCDLDQREGSQTYSAQNKSGSLLNWSVPALS
jgi:hypothetical protein